MHNALLIAAALYAGALLFLLCLCMAAKDGDRRAREAFRAHVLEPGRSRSLYERRRRAR